MHKSCIVFGSMLMLLAIPVLDASGMRTVRIIISGGDLSAPVEIADPEVVRPFQAGAGIGNFEVFGAHSRPSYPSQSFIVDWELGATSAPPSPKIYQVIFQTTREDHDTYIVHYAINSVTGHGYVFFPGKGDRAYGDNVYIMLRGIEGQWFHAGSDWEKLANPLIAAAPKKP